MTQGPSSLRELLAGFAAAPASYKRWPNLPGSDANVLAGIGAAVCERLERSGRAGRLPALELDIFEVPAFLSADECERLRRLIDADAKPSTLLTGGSNLKRSSYTCRLAAAEPLVAAVERRIAALLGLPLDHSETVQGQRYWPGQQFKLHNDYFAGGQPYSATVASEGGQRTWTAMVFLGGPAAGGRTAFPRAGIEIEPRRGLLLTWNNNDRAGLSNPYSHHAGEIVDAGNKYVLTKWFRERPWSGSAGSDALRV